MLSVVIITFNEENNIRRCLASVQEVADEIVVVDSGSTDATERICNEYGARFIRHNWEGYSAQKNFANAQAANDWVFSIDADEEVDTELKAAILQRKKDGLSGAYAMDRLTNYCGKFLHHCWRPDTKIRIWNRHDGEWEGDIHETIKFRNNSIVNTLQGNLNHYTYHTVSEHIRQADKFSSLTAQKAFNCGEKSKSACAIRCKTAWKFIRDYIFHLGFLDGYYGFVVCRISAFATFLKYTKLNELHLAKNEESAPNHH